MIGLIQRVSTARVDIGGATVGSIDSGLLVLAGFKRGDCAGRIPRFVERLLNYRVFADEAGRMNKSLREVGGGLLVVPQFTLAADTNSGNRPSFSPAAPPEVGRELFEALITQVEKDWPDSAFGQFGADMQVSLTNDGPVTFWLEVG
ncbi:MAG TPA: D-aminoacyl-tRNA deacylase [Wenzhouxiangella sp.]|nr:D-aminoacyl-tRNA deacylase [Wenzhouxiangella sp.]